MKPVSVFRWPIYWHFGCFWASRLVFLGAHFAKSGPQHLAFRRANFGKIQPSGPAFSDSSRKTMPNGVVHVQNGANLANSAKLVLIEGSGPRDHHFRIPHEKSCRRVGSMLKMARIWTNSIYPVQHWQLFGRGVTKTACAATQRFAMIWPLLGHHLATSWPLVGH